MCKLLFKQDIYGLKIAIKNTLHIKKSNIICLFILFRIILIQINKTRKNCNVPVLEVQIALLGILKQLYNFQISFPLRINK